MAVTVFSGALQGIDAIPIQVEVDLLRRLPRVTIVGLAASAVQEASERIRSAIVGAGYDFPRQRVVVNLAPADVRKTGTIYDLPMAIGILAAAEELPLEKLSEYLFVGELSLHGELRPMRGAISYANLARKEGKTLIVPVASAEQAALVPDVTVLGAESLEDVVEFLRGEHPLEAAENSLDLAPPPGVDFSDVRGQALARRALEIAAAGGHHVLMMGPPGCGKSVSLGPQVTNHHSSVKHTIQTH